MEAPKLLNATISSITKLTSHVYQYSVSLPTPLQFIPGQYATCIIDAQTRRQYSFATPSMGTSQFTIVLDVSPMGPGSKFFLEKKVGDRMQVLAPLGTFHFDVPSHPVVFVATGTGVVPFRTMIEDYLLHNGTQDSTLLWGLRYEEDIFWKDVFDALQSKYQNFHYHIILSKPTPPWQGKIGHVTEHICDIPQFETYTFYLCGNRHMIQDVKTDLLAHQVSEGHIKTELF